MQESLSKAQSALHASGWGIDAEVVAAGIDISKILEHIEQISIQSTGRDSLYCTALLFNLDNRLDNMNLLSMTLLSRIFINGARAELKMVVKAYRDATDMGEIGAD